MNFVGITRWVVPFFYFGRLSFAGMGSIMATAADWGHHLLSLKKK